jgi:hypothetical protein
MSGANITPMPMAMATKTAFLTLDCGTAKLVPLTVEIEMAGDETGAGPVAGTLPCHLPTVGLGSGIAKLESVPPMGKFGLRQNSPVTDHTAGAD